MKKWIWLFSCVALVFLAAACNGEDPNPDAGHNIDVPDVGPDADPDVGPDADVGPSCEADELKCDGDCIDPTSDDEHCGACGHFCEADFVCSQGVCVCTGGLEACDASCVNLDQDPLNCGSCGNACDAGDVCDGGVCSDTCDAGQEACNGSCVDTDTDIEHCGGCGQACGADQTCNAGECECTSASLTLCFGVCVDTETDNDYCGDCFTECGNNEICVAGVCEIDEPAGVSFSDDVVPIFSTCTGCHGASGGLNLSADPYDALVNVDAQCAGRVRVIPGDSENSYLIAKLEGHADICGSPMPPGGAVNPADIETIADWIDQGALNN